MKPDHMLCAAVIFSLSATPISAQQACKFDFFQVPTPALGVGAQFPDPSGLADGSLATGSFFGDPGAAPYSHFGRLDTRVGEDNRFCTTQAVEAKDVLATAAHCVKNNKTGEMVSDFQLRMLASANAAPVTNPKCIVTPAAWVTGNPSLPRFNWAADYAFVVMQKEVADGFMTIGQARSSEVRAFGLPTGVGRHVQLLSFPATLMESGIDGFGLAAHRQPGAGLGMSGGGWIESALEQSGRVERLVGLSTTSQPPEKDGDPFLQMGPMFDQCAIAMLRFVRERCSGL